MTNDNVTKPIQPGTFNDQLTEILRKGAHALLAHAVEAEVSAFLESHADLKTSEGHQRVVRHGHLPVREVMTGIGAVTVRQPRARDREAAADSPDRLRFTPSILPPHVRRSKSIETLLPILYLKGISTGDFGEALAALLGPDAPGLSATTIARLKQVWSDEHARWQSRDLSARHYVYVWADGIHLQARLEDEKQCILVIIGATPEGKKELVGFTDGTRESAHDWRALLLDLKRRGLNVAPKIVVADGALGFWKALGEVWPTTREQRCWVHKTANVLNKLPKSQQPQAKRALQEIWMAETRGDAETAFDAFIETYTLKYELSWTIRAHTNRRLCVTQVLTSAPNVSFCRPTRQTSIRSSRCSPNSRRRCARPGSALSTTYRIDDASCSPNSVQTKSPTTSQIRDRRRFKLNTLDAILQSSTTRCRR